MPFGLLPYSLHPTTISSPEIVPCPCARRLEVDRADPHLCFRIVSKVLHPRASLRGTSPPPPLGLRQMTCVLCCFQASGFPCSARPFRLRAAPPRPVPACSGRAATLGRPPDTAATGTTPNSTTSPASCRYRQRPRQRWWHHRVGGAGGSPVVSCGGCRVRVLRPGAAWRVRGTSGVWRSVRVGDGAYAVLRGRAPEKGGIGFGGERGRARCCREVRVAINPPSRAIAPVQRNGGRGWGRLSVVEGAGSSHTGRNCNPRDLAIQSTFGRLNGYCIMNNSVSISP